MVERATGDLIGEAGLEPLDDEGPEIELGYALAVAGQGRGHATEAGRAVLGALFCKLGFERVDATGREENAASRRVLSKLGFSRMQRPTGATDLACFVLERG